MPFDPQVSETTLRRRQLCEALRNEPDNTPRGKWTYCFTDGCAIGMAKRLWPELRCYGAVVVHIGLSAEQAYKAFCRANYHYNCAAHEVTASMVADYIEELALRSDRDSLSAEEQER